MFTKNRPPIDYSTVREWIDNSSKNAIAVQTCLNKLKRDIYLLIYNDAHKIISCKREYIFSNIRRESKISKKILDEFVNTGLVETVLKIPHGEVNKEVLLALKNHANIEDWVAIYDNACAVRYAMRKPKRNRSVRKNSLKFKVFPSYNQIMSAIKLYYKNNDKPNKKTEDDWEADIKQYQDVDRRDIIYVKKKLDKIRRPPPCSVTTGSCL